MRALRSAFPAYRGIPTSADVGSGLCPKTLRPFEKGRSKLSKWVKTKLYVRLFLIYYYLLPQKTSLL